jgi:polyphosphate kinase
MNPIAQKETPAENPVETLSIDDSLFLFNRELSWLEFNRRVLEEALDERNPLLERLKFLSIFSTNLDEFFMIRVAGLKEQVAERVDKVSIDGLTAKQQLTGIWEKVRPMIAEQSLCLREEVLPRLAKEGIEICAYKNLSESEKKWIDEYFLKNVFPVLTPQAVDVSHPFPYISNLSLNLGLFVEPDKTIHHGNLRHLFKNRRFVRVKLPPNVSRLIRLENSETRYAALGELIAANIHHLLPNMKTSECFLFRLTRDADIELREDEAGDLLRTIESELHHQKRFSFPVRLEVEASMPEEMVNYLTEAIGLTEQEV